MGCALEQYRILHGTLRLTNLVQIKEKGHCISNTEQSLLDFPLCTNLMLTPAHFEHLGLKCSHRDWDYTELCSKYNYFYYDLYCNALQYSKCVRPLLTKRIKVLFKICLLRNSFFMLCCSNCNCSNACCWLCEQPNILNLQSTTIYHLHGLILSTIFQVCQFCSFTV